MSYRKHTHGVNVRLDPTLRADFARAAKANGSDSAKVLRTLMLLYVNAAKLDFGCTCYDPVVVRCPVHHES